MTPAPLAAEIAAHLQLVLTEEQRLACRYLEHYGFRFCVHFGVSNCVEKFQAHFRRQSELFEERVVG